MDATDLIIAAIGAFATIIAVIVDQSGMGSGWVGTVSRKQDLAERLKASASTPRDYLAYALLKRDIANTVLRSYGVIFDGDKPEYTGVSKLKGMTYAYFAGVFVCFISLSVFTEEQGAASVFIPSLVISAISTVITALAINLFEKHPEWKYNLMRDSIDRKEGVSKDILDIYEDVKGELARHGRMRGSSKRENLDPEERVGDDGNDEVHKGKEDDKPDN